MFLCISCHLRIQDIRKDLRCEVNDRYIDPSCMQIFRRLKTDETCTDHDRFFHAVCLCICTDSFCIIRRPHLKYTRKIFSIDRELCRGCTDRDHQLVIRTDFCVSGLYVFHCNFFLRRIERNRLFSRTHLNTCKS